MSLSFSSIDMHAYATPSSSSVCSLQCYLLFILGGIITYSLTQLTDRTSLLASTQQSIWWALVETSMRNEAIPPKWFYCMVGCKRLFPLKFMAGGGCWCLMCDGDMEDYWCFELLFFEAIIDFVKKGFVVPLYYDDYWSKLVCVLFYSLSYFRPSKESQCFYLGIYSFIYPSTINCLYCNALYTFAFILMLLFIDNVPHKNGFECASAEVCNYGQAYYPRAGLSSLCHMPLPSTKLSCDFMSSSWYFVMILSH